MMPEDGMRECLLYEFKLGSNAVQATRNICSLFGEKTVSVQTARKWFKQFRSGDNEPRSVYWSICDKLKVEIKQDPKQTCQKLVQKFKAILWYQRILGKISNKVSEWIFSWQGSLFPSGTNCNASTSASPCCRHKKASFLDQVLTCNEKWVLYHNRKRKHHWSSTGFVSWSPN